LISLKRQREEKRRERWREKKKKRRNVSVQYNAHILPIFNDMADGQSYERND
jgi:hypothetical protein